MRAVVDTNVLVRALINPRGTVGPVLGRLANGDYTLLYSEALLEELVDVLGQPRIRDKYHLSADVVQAVRQLFAWHGELVVPDRPVTTCRDPKDNKVLEAALAEQADVIVSGDDDLLVLHRSRGSLSWARQPCWGCCRHERR